MLDEEMMSQMRSTLPAGVPNVFISSVSGMGIAQLKDMLWESLNR
jgi:GTP-binding protein